MKKGSDFRLALFDSYLTVTQSSQSVPHRSRGLISYRGQVMRIGIQGHGYGGVSEKLLHDLRMHSPAKEQRGAGVPQVVEAYLRQASPLQKRLEGALDQILGTSAIERRVKNYWSDVRERLTALIRKARSLHQAIVVELLEQLAHLALRF